MKKLITPIAVLMLIIGTYAQLNAQVLPEVVQKQLEKIRNSGNDSQYDRVMQFILEKTESDNYSAGKLNSISRTNYKFDTKGNSISNLSESSSDKGTTWNPSSKLTSTYDSNNNNLSHEYYRYDTALKTWVRNYTVLYKYNVQNKPITFAFLSYKDNDSTNFEVATKFIYDNKNLLIQEDETVLAKFSTPYQLSLNKREYTNNTNGKVDLAKTYDVKVNPPKYSSLVKYTYDAKNNEILNENFYVNSSNSEVLESVRRKTYNTSNLIIKQESASVSGGTESPNSKSEYTYNKDNNLSNEKYYNVPVVSYVLLYSTNYFYRQFVGNQDIMRVKFSISPNPAQGFLNFNLPETVNAISIFSVDGKLRLAQTLPSSQVDISHLEPGIYHIQIQTSTGFGVQKFIKQ